MTLTYGSLFSGVGGFDMGFDQAGYECRWQVEWDKHCQQTLNYHWPDTPKHLDVQDVRGDQIAPVDVIIYGSPCQDLSVAGKRAGIEGHKSSMFYEATRIIKEMRDATGNTYPRIAVWENVPGALSSNQGRDFQAVLETLDDIGALGQWWNILDAQHFGVPQRRRRIFLVSVFDPAIAERAGTGEILPVAESRRRNTAKGRTAGTITAALTANGVGTCGPDDNQAQAGHLIAFSHTQGLDPQPSHTHTPTLRSGGGGGAIMTTEPIIAFHPHYHDGARPQGDVINTITSRWGTGGNNATMIAMPIEKPVAFAENQRAELRESEIALSVTTGGGKPGSGYPALRHGSIVRRLTPIECERLMGWPDNHTLHRADGKTNSDSTRYKMCGNGVATPVARWIAEHLKEHLKK